MAYIAFHFHWPHHEILMLEHAQRRQWVAEIVKINLRFNENQS